MAVNNLQFKVALRENKNRKSAGYGKFYVEKARTTTLSQRGFIEHLTEHGLSMPRSVIEAVLTQIAQCILFMGGDNTLYYPQNGASIGAQRAYFKIGDDNSSAPTLLSFNIYFGDSETTGIITISKESGSQGDDDGWYTLDGRKLSGKSTKKGLYIVNGRKVVVK